jgi:hypothetical protein
MNHGATTVIVDPNTRLISASKDITDLAAYFAAIPVAVGEPPQ